MTNENKQEFATVMYGIADNFGGQISKDGLKLRFSALIEYSITDIRKAGEFLIKNRVATFPAVPTVKEFIDAINSVKGNTLNPKYQAEIEADIVVQKVRRQGSYAKIDFENPLTQHLMSTRWPYNSWASTVEESELKWWRKEFVEAFVAYSEAAHSEIAALEYRPKGYIPTGMAGIGDMLKITQNGSVVES